METVSRKRGRPSKFTEEELARLRIRYPGVGDRQRRNLFYADKAKWVLNRLIKARAEEDSEENRILIENYEWILQRPSILTELGRILGKDWEPRRIKESKEMEESWQLFGQAVGWLGDKRPSAKLAIAVLRSKRTGEAHPADANDLAHKIALTIIEYLATHSGAEPGFLERTQNAVPSALEVILRSRKST